MNRQFKSTTILTKCWRWHSKYIPTWEILSLSTIQALIEVYLTKNRTSFNKTPTPIGIMSSEKGEANANESKANESMSEKNNKILNNIIFREIKNVRIKKDKINKTTQKNVNGDLKKLLMKIPTSTI